MGHEGGLALLATLVAFGVVSATLYFLVLKPILPIGASAERTGAGNNPNFRANQRARAQEPSTNANPPSAQGKESSSIDKLLAQCAAFPAHAAPGSKSRSVGSNLLVEGLLAFQHSRAAGYEQAKGGDVAAQNRKERARVLSRMLALENSSTGSGSPPIRGSTLVVSIPVAEISCPKLRRVLLIFATYYNLLVILVVPSETTTDALEAAKRKLRGAEGNGEELSSECLPDHRIVGSSTSAGRIAFVRQLARAEIILDFDTEVKTQLTRFGYRVINYKKQQSDKTVSQLGTQLMS